MPYPVPASLEYKPRATPYRIASRTVAPANPPMPAMGVNADLKINKKACGTMVICINKMPRPPRI